MILCRKYTGWCTNDLTSMATGGRGRAGDRPAGGCAAVPAAAAAGRSGPSLRLSGLCVLHSESSFYAVWVRWALDSPKRRLPARVEGGPPSRARVQRAIKAGGVWPDEGRAGIFPRAVLVHMENPSRDRRLPHERIVCPRTGLAERSAGGQGLCEVQGQRAGLITSCLWKNPPGQC